MKLIISVVVGLLAALGLFGIAVFVHNAIISFFNLSFTHEYAQIAALSLVGAEAVAALYLGFLTFQYAREALR